MKTKRTAKKLLALALTLLMLVTTMPLALAEEPVSDPGCEHSFGDYVPQNDATCILNGHETATCSLCGAQISREIPDSALGHQESDWIYPDGFECEVGGLRYIKCLRCDSILAVQTIEPHTCAEVIDPGVERVPCVSDGLTAGSHCDVCGRVVMPQTVIRAHNFEETVVHEATCLTNGKMSRVCVNCGETSTIIIPAKGHTIVRLDAVAPTCTAPGYTEGTYCGVCGKVFEEPIEVPMLAHMDEDGNDICDVCGQSLSNPELPTSGQCGDNVYWSYDTTTATLTISGEGDMWDYGWSSNQPWSADRGEIQFVIIEDGVTGIGNFAFSDLRNMESVEIANSVTKISLGAFEYDDKLQSVTIPENVEIIEAHVFDQCEALSSIVVDENNSYYSSDSNGALYNKDQTVFFKWPEGSLIEHAVLPESVVEISYEDGFQFARYLKTIDIPASVEVLSNNAFWGTSALECFVVDSDNPYYSDEAGCLLNKEKTELICCPSGKQESSFAIPDTVRTLCSHSFYECDNLQEVIFPEGLLSIGEAEDDEMGGQVFFGCERITWFSIPSSVIHIAYDAFDYCVALQGFDVAESNPNYCTDESGTLYNKDKTLLIQYPIGKEETTFEIPEGVTKLGDSAFDYCHLQNIIFPRSLRNIGYIHGSTIETISVLNFNCVIRELYCEKIYGYKGSTAELYAAENDIEFESLCDHENTVSDPGQPATCTEDGWTAGVYCNDCENWIEGNEVIPAGHKDDNGDFICDVCGESTIAVIHAGETLPVDVVGGELTYLRFVPDETATFVFTSLSDDDTYGYLYDDEMNLLISNDDGDEDNNFKIVRELTAGETYFYGVKFFDKDQSGSFDVRLFKDCSHLNTTEVPEQPATCTEVGYTAGVYCSDCETWIEGHNLIYAHHTDEDKNFLCDVCGENMLYTIHIGETLTVHVDGYQETFIAFTPEESGWYTFKTNSYGLYGYLYDSEMNELNSYENEFTDPWMTDHLTAGETYYYTVGGWLCDEDVQLTKEDVFTGPCGDNAIWTMIPSKNELHIEGEGALWEDTQNGNVVPWSDYMQQINSVIIDDEITNIPANAFFGAYNLKSAHFPDALKTIGAYAFFFCTSLKDADLPNALETIGICAFQGCTALRQIWIPDGVQTIGDLAFAGCASLEFVILPESLTALAQGLFLECYRLENVTIPASVTTIEGTGDLNAEGNISPFAYCFNLETVTNYSATAVTAATVFHTLSLPESLDRDDFLTYTVFKTNAMTLNRIGVLTSDEAQAYLAQQLENYFGEDYEDIVRSMEEAISDDTQAGMAAGFPEGLTFRCFSDSAEYAYCSENNISYELLDRGQCGDDVYFSFERATGTLSIFGTGEMWDFDVMSGKKAGWRDYADSIQTIVVQAGVTALGWGAFSDCWSGLTSVTLPNTLTSLGAYSFEHCGSLTNVTIPNSVTSIGWGAFMNCDGLTQITIPENVANIESYAFIGCSSLTRIDVNEENSFYSSDDSGCLYNKEKTELFVYPFGNERTDFTIPDGVISIKFSAFNNCSQLKSITVPNSVMGIEYMAFSGCTGLEDVYYLGTEAQWNAIDINNHYEENAPLLNATIHFVVVGDDTDVSITYDADAFEADVQIEITEVPTGDENSRAWNITPTLDGEKVQPNAPVLVKLPIPAGWDKALIVLTHIKPDGTVEYPEFTIEGDYVVFWATEFSEYTLEQKLPHVHSYDGGVVTKDATCKEEGVRTFTCVDGDDSYNEAIPVNPENHADYGTHVEKAYGATCTTEGYTGDTVCNGCGKTIATGSSIPASGHSDADNDGYCDVCGEMMVDDGYCPQCGKIHNEPIIGWLIGIIHRIVYRLTHLFG